MPRTKRIILLLLLLSLVILIGPFNGFVTWCWFDVGLLIDGLGEYARVYFHEFYLSIMIILSASILGKLLLVAALLVKSQKTERTLVVTGATIILLALAGIMFYIVDAASPLLPLLTSIPFTLTLRYYSFWSTELRSIA